MLLVITLSCLAALFLGLFLAPRVISLAQEYKIYDVPHGTLKNHKKPVPYLGALIIYIPVLLFLGVLALTPSYLPIASLIIALTGVLLLGLYDDLVGLTPGYKISAQLCAALYLVASGVAFTHPSTHPVISFFLSLFFIVSTMNIFNLIDIMDGLAGVLTLSSVTCLLVLSISINNISLALLLSALIGSVSGFLWFNKKPAQIYLGDSGSLFIGGLLGSAALLFPWSNLGSYSFLALPLFFFIPALEVACLIAIRLSLKIKFYHGSRHHFVHFLQAKHWSTESTLIFAGSTSFFMGLIAMLFVLEKISFITLILSAFFVSAAWLLTVYSQYFELTQNDLLFGGALARRAVGFIKKKTERVNIDDLEGMRDTAIFGKDKKSGPQKGRTRGNH